MELRTCMDDFSVEALERAVRTLSRRDPVIRALARRWGTPTFRPNGEPFVTLVHSIVGQQISGRAAESILQRLRQNIGEFTPSAMATVPDDLYRASGISPQKLGYLRSLIDHVTRGELELDRLELLDDAAILGELTAVRGIGIWTAQMFLIFSLARFDVLPVGDLGVRKGTQIAYDLPDLPSPAQVESIAEEWRWAPFRSIASWYMWRALES